VRVYVLPSPTFLHISGLISMSWEALMPYSSHSRSQHNAQDVAHEFSVNDPISLTQSCHFIHLHYHAQTASVVYWSRVPGYSSRGPGFDCWRYQIFWVLGLEQGPLSLMSIIEEPLEWKSSGSGSRKSRLTAMAIRCANHVTPPICKSCH
jgi:hypothetical protein